MFQISNTTLRTALLAGAATATALSFSAPARADTATETVVVTGSRIPQTGLTSTSPVTSVDSTEMKFEGTTSVDNLVASLPSATADYNAVSSAFSGALGTANVDLRQLGSSRTLVLIDGKRLMPGDPILPVADLNNIPAQLVDRVEVLTGGASAVYGSDAIAGVVNFIMRKDFQGVEVDGQFSIDQAGNDHSAFGIPFSTLDAAIGTPAAKDPFWGGQDYDGTLILGTNTADGKGNVTAWVGYRKTRAVVGSQRDFSNCTLGSDYVAHLSCEGSSNYNRWISFDNLFSGTPRSDWDMFESGSGAPGSGTFGAYTGANNQKFNFGAPAYLQQPSTRYTAGFDAHYEINPWLTAYANMMFADNASTTVVSPTAAFLGSGPANFPGSISPGYVQVNCDNPLMTAQENHQLCGLLPGDAIDGFGKWGGQANITPGLSLLQIGRRNVEAGGRVYDTRHTSYRMVVGAKGDINDAWSYEVFAQFGESLYAFETTHDWSKARVENALNVDPATGQCFSVENNSDPNCVPLDLFNGFGSYSPAASNYIALKGFETGYTEEHVIGASVTGDFGAQGIQSPWAKSPVAAAFGVESREELLKFNVDQELASGDSYGNGGKILDVPRSGFIVNEGYFEFRVPLIQNMPFAEDLTLNGGARVSDYSNIGTNVSYKYGAEWQPVDDFRLRGSIEKASRAPNVLESFTPNNVVLFSGADPCASSTAGQCATVANAGTGLLACPAGQCNHQTGGNTGLVAEAADTKTIGIVFTPSFLSGFSVTVDYFNIKVQDYIGTLGASTILGGCYGPSASAASIAFYCPLVHRSASGAIYGAGYVQDLNLNLPFIKTSGVDFEVNYATDLDAVGLEGAGSLSTNFIGSWMTQWDLAPSPVSDPKYFDCAGLFGVTCGSPYPRWKHKMRVTWTSPWDFDLSLAWRYVGDVSYDANQTNPLLQSLGGFGATTCPGGVVVNGAGDCVDKSIHAFNYFDLSGVWHVAPGYELRAGVNNLFGLNPPALDGNVATPIPFGAANTFPGTYDSLGRNLFIGGTVKF